MLINDLCYFSVLWNGENHHKAGALLWNGRHIPVLTCGGWGIFPVGGSLKHVYRELVQ